MRAMLKVSDLKKKYIKGQIYLYLHSYYSIIKPVLIGISSYLLKLNLKVG